VRLTRDRRHDPVAVPSVAGTGQPAAGLVCKALPEPERPLARSRVADHDAASSEDLVHAAWPERKPDAGPDRRADALGQQAAASLARANQRRHHIQRPDPIWPAKPVRHQAEEVNSIA